MHTVRTSPLDLEIAGDLLDVPAGESRYLTREQLLSLPQVTYTVEDDPNFAAPAQIAGVLLDELASRLSAHPESDLVVAICSDLYRGYYPREYLSAHHPILVLTINNLPPSGWPKDSADHSTYKGPFLISHPKFVPAFHILSHADVPQIPWGVVRLEFHDEKKTFDAIAPRGPHAESVTVQDGFHIAQQNCLRCHNQGKDGGMKAGRSWQILSSWATASPDYFSSYATQPKKQKPAFQYAGFPGIRRCHRTGFDLLLQDLHRAGETMTLRLAKISLVLAVALYYAFIVFNNLTDYNSNFQFIRHVLMMDSTSPDNHAMWRAINQPAIHTLFYVAHHCVGNPHFGSLCLGSIAIIPGNSCKRANISSSC